MMTDRDICREYREAKDKKKQIDIIADQLPGMDRDDVDSLLHQQPCYRLRDDAWSGKCAGV